MNKHFSLTIFGSITLLLSSSLLAAPGALDQAPLYVGPAVDPNIVILSDDSGSMDWALMTPENSGVIILGDYAYFYTHPAPDNEDLWIVASEDYLLSIGEAAPVSGVWRAWNADYNTMYYNPAMSYSPWAGYDNAGALYAASNPLAARYNPYDATIGTLNLTATTTYTTDYGANTGLGTFTVTNFYPARYYTWTDSDSDNIVDDNDAHTLVEIRSTTPTYTGGTNRSDCAAAPVCTYAEEIQNFANWFSYHRSREYVAKYAMSQALKDVTGVRAGYATINNNNAVGIAVASMNIDPEFGNKRALFNNLFGTHSSGSTPLRTKLRDAGRYYECVADNIFDGSTGDGTPDVTCPILPASDYGQCQKNFTILMTDGFYSNLDSPGIGNTDTDGPLDFDGGDYADGFSNTLADVAMDFYERDLSGLADEVPASGIDTATHQHMTTFTVAFGVTGSLDPDGTKTPGDATDTDPSDAGFNWPDPSASDANKIDDLWHTAFNGRGAFFSAQNPSALISALGSAIESATKGTSSSAAVAFNTTTLDTDSVVYQALFNPTEDWKGELIATKLNADGTLADSPKWNAGDKLNNKSRASRKIITSRVIVTPGTPDTSRLTGIPFKVLTDLSASQQADLNTGPSAIDSNGQARLDYLRGDRSNESKDLFFRDRTNILGDIVHSNPVFVGKPQMNYPDYNTDNDFGDATNLYSDFKIANTSRAGLIYIGANDGMLHAFDEDEGNEVFAYIPSMLFSNATGAGLHYLTDPGYTHRYYVDLSPTISDVFYTRNSVSAWRTVLVGGLRAGGRGLFALDITDPTVLGNADSGTNAAKTVLWEFTSTDDPDLGYTMSKPTIAMMENGKWGVVFGNGYNSGVGSDGEAKLFILFLEQGLDGEWDPSAGVEDYLKITTGIGSVGTPNGLSTPQLVDTNGNGKADRAYAGDLEGNLWAFDLLNSSTGQWKIAYKQGNNPKPLFTATNSDGTVQPITSKPVVATQLQDVSGNPSPNLMVFFGTGQYLVNADKTSTGEQTFYGVWDDGTKEVDRTDLLEQTFTAETTSENRVVTDTAISYGTNQGWFIDLPTSGERMVVNPKIRGKYVFFNTLIPGTELCVPEGGGWVMAVKQENGGQPNEPVFDINNDGVIDADDQLNGNNPSGFKLDGIPAASTMLADVMYTPNDDGNIDARKISVSDGGNGGRLSWQELTQ